MPLLRIFCTGLFVSFLGTLPLGTLNVFAMQVSIDVGVGSALWFSAGALLAEIGYVRLSLVAMNWVRQQKKLFRALEWVTIVLLLLLALSSFRSAFSPYQGRSMAMTGPSFLTGWAYYFLLGLLLSAVNPVQIPFWFGWSTVFFTRGILLPRREYYNSYIAGIGLGTFAGNGVFIFGGRFFVDTLSMHHSLVNGLIGTVFLLTAILQMRKILLHKDAVENL